MGFNSREEAAVPPGSRGTGTYFWVSPLQHRSQVLQLPGAHGEKPYQLEMLSLSDVMGMDKPFCVLYTISFFTSFSKSEWSAAN